jgi:hypothetical protein
MPVMSVERFNETSRTMRKSEQSMGKTAGKLEIDMTEMRLWRNITRKAVLTGEVMFSTYQGR